MFEVSGLRDYTFPGAKTNAQISCAVTAQLISTFAFGDAKSWFSHDVYHIHIFKVL